MGMHACLNSWTFVFVFMRNILSIQYCTLLQLLVNPGLQVNEAELHMTWQLLFIVTATLVSLPLFGISSSTFSTARLPCEKTQDKTFCNLLLKSRACSPCSGPKHTKKRRFFNSIEKLGAAALRSNLNALWKDLLVREQSYSQQHNKTQLSSCRRLIARVSINDQLLLE